MARGTTPLAALPVRGAGGRQREKKEVCGVARIMVRVSGLPAAAAAAAAAAAVD